MSIYIKPLSFELFKDYFVSVDGNIIDIVNNKAIYQRTSRQGYKYIVINKTIYSVHRIVAFCHIINPKNYNIVNHINGTKSDNRAENLEWCTSSQNNTHAYKTGLKKPKNQKEENNSNARLTINDVNYIRKSLKEKTKTGKQLSEEFGVHKVHIYRINTSARW